MAYWIYGKDYEVQCSNCHNRFIQMRTAKFCPVCKSKMENAFRYMFPPNNKPLKKVK